MKYTRIILALLLALLLCGCAAQETAVAPSPAPTAETSSPAAQTAEPTPAPPPLLAHAAFLFPDEDGFLNPDEPLSAAELARALEALQPNGEGAALADFSGTRREFARAAAELLGWSAEEALTTAEGALAPVDLDPADADFALLLEASVPHTPDAQGAPWPEAVQAITRESGPFLHGAEGYCVDENGFLLRDAASGPLFYGPDGRFSSGDAELDGYVTEVVASLQAQFPADAQDRPAMLRHCYDYVYENFSYLGRRHVEQEGVDWSAEEAKIIFSTGKGNCYHYSAAFRALARRLGYPAYTILRSLDGNPANIHAWTEIVIDEVPYVFDPQLNQRYGNERFMLTYKQAQVYGGYTRPTRETEFY